MTHMQDIAKVATGFGLVLKESVNRLVVKDLGSSAMEFLKKLTLTATDIAGLTRGRVQPHHSHEAIFEELKEQRDGSSRTTSPGYSVKGSAPRGKYGQKRKDGFSRDQGEGQQAEELFAPKKPEGSSVNFRESVSTSEHKSLSRRMSLPSVGSNLKGDDVREKGASDAAQTPQRTERTRSNKDTQTMGRGHAATSVRPGNSTQETGSGVETAKVARLDSGDGPVSTTKRKPRERRVPSTPLGRVLGFAGLGAGLAWGTVQESAKRFLAGPSLGSPGEFVLSPLMSETNAERVAVALCRMRGAALKMGQMLSIQDETLVPAPLLLALEKVRQGADIMPKSQLMKTITTELGPNWRARLRSFDEEPIASASIGQVHRAITNDGKEVAMKVQYPGVANSIDSDIANVKLLLEYTNIIPGGLYLDQAMRVAKDELARECNYRLEAANQKRFRELVKNEKGLYVPLVFDHLSSKHVLTTELVSGIPIDQVTKLGQGIRNNIGTQLLSLTLKELFVFLFMQTDPNWGNFLYDEATGTLNLIDFGAARDYPKHFVDNYLKMILACANKNRAQVLEMSIKLGFLTGQETKIMLDAHTEAAFVIGVPFQKPGPFDFGSSDMPQRVVYLGPTMLKYRLTPPPDEGYSLHRKLSGAFCACKKLGAVVRCREMFMQVYDRHKFSDKDEPKPGRAPGSRN